MEATAPPPTEPAPPAPPPSLGPRPEEDIAPPAPPTHWSTSLFDGFWTMFRVTRDFDLGVDYVALAEKVPLKLAVRGKYRTYAWNRRIGSQRTVGSMSYGASIYSGDPVNIAMATEVAALQGRFLRTELDKLRAVLYANAEDRLAWLDIALVDLAVEIYGQASSDKK